MGGESHDDDVRSRLESYKGYIESERGRLLTKRSEAEQSLQEAQSELQDLRSANGSSLADTPSGSVTEGDIDEMRRKLAETSIQLEE